MFGFGNRCWPLPVSGGRISLVGRVPAHLAYESDAPPEVFAELLQSAQIAGPGIARGIAERKGYTFRPRTFADEAEARAAVEAEGFAFGNPQPDQAASAPPAKRRAARRKINRR